MALRNSERKLRPGRKSPRRWTKKGVAVCDGLFSAQWFQIRRKGLGSFRSIINLAPGESMTFHRNQNR